MLPRVSSLADAPVSGNADRVSVIGVAVLAGTCSLWVQRGLEAIERVRKVWKESVGSSHSSQGKRGALALQWSLLLVRIR